MRQEAGFTLFEIMIAMALVVMLSGLGMIGYGRMQARSELNTAADEIRTLLKLAREKSVAQIDDKEYRVVGNDRVVTLETTEGIELERFQIRKQVLTEPLNFSFTFARITGEVAACPSGCTVNLISGGLTRTVEISSIGLVR